MKRSIATFAVLIATTSAASSAHADIRDLIYENKDETAVVVAVPEGSGKGESDDGYGLLLEPQDHLAERMGLTNPTLLQNDTFTVVEDEGTTPLPTTDFDGRNILFHMMEAKAYYTKLVQGSGFPDDALQHQIIVRARVDHAYNVVLHFSQYTDYNNSRYIPANYAGQWGREVWFDQRKPQLMNMDWYGLIVSSGFALTAKNWILLGVTAPISFLEHYNGGIDASKIPSVIYHETFHWASDTDGLFPMASEGNPVAEDYANYFGSSLLGRPEMAMIDAYASRFYKHTYKKIQAVKDTSPTTYNASSFGPSVFWQIRNWLGQERGDQLIWNSLHYLNGSFRETDVPNAVLSAAGAMSTITSAEVTKISALFDKYKQSYINLDIKAGVYTPNQTPVQGDLSQMANDMDASAIRDAGLKQAEAIAQIPANLKAQGVTVTAEQEANFAAVADALADQANQPDFKDKVVGALKKVGGGFKRAGIDVLEGMGYVGSAAYSISAAPLTFGTDFFTGLFFGHGLISESRQELIEQLVGGGSGVVTFYYAYSGLTALGYTLAGPIDLTSMGVVTINSLICGGRSATGTSELDKYCATNNKIIQVITLDVAKAGAVTGEDLRHAITKVAQFIAGMAKKLF